MALMRSDTWLNTVTVNGALFPLADGGVWDTFKGGDVDSSADVYHAGGMAPQEVVGGQPTISTVTLDKALDLQADWASVQQLMVGGPGTVGNASITIHRQPLDINKNPSGTPLIYNGIVKSCAPGDTDSNKSDIQMWSITAVVNGPVGT
jgi:hypothetical protein